MPSSVPLVARETTQRRKNIKTASSTPTAVTASPRTQSPRSSPVAIGPSITFLVTSGTTIVAPTVRLAKTNMAM